MTDHTPSGLPQPQTVAAIERARKALHGCYGADTTEINVGVLCELINALSAPAVETVAVQEAPDIIAACMKCATPELCAIRMECADRAYQSRVAPPLPVAPKAEPIAQVSEIDGKKCVTFCSYKALYETPLWTKLYATPQAASAQPAWENFPSYLIDHCEGETITEEGLQRSLADMLRDPKYSTSAGAQPVVADTLTALQTLAAYVGNSPSGALPHAVADAIALARSLASPPRAIPAEQAAAVENAPDPQYRDDNWWRGWNAAVRAQVDAEQAAPTEPRFSPWFCQGCGRNAPELKRNTQGQNMCPVCLAAHPHEAAPTEMECVYRQELIDWAAEQWHAQVAKRPMVNVHRRSLDDVWRQVLRHLGVDDRARLGPTHDELRSEITTKEWNAMQGKEAS